MKSKRSRTKKCSRAKSLVWQFIGTSVRGTSHEKLNLPCQDAYYYERVSPEIIIMAVADGAGSAPLSDVGATLATRVAVTELSEFFKIAGKTINPEIVESAVYDSVAAAKMAVEKEAETRGVKSRDLSATLLLTVATPSSVTAFQIGDGGIVIKDSARNIIGMTTPELSEYVNETCFLTLPNALERAQFKVWKGRLKQLAMFSDGIQLICLKMPEGTPYEKFFNPIFNFAGNAKDKSNSEAQLGEFLSSPKVRDLTNDDITLTVATFGEQRCR